MKRSMCKEETNFIYSSKQFFLSSLSIESYLCRCFVVRWYLFYNNTLHQFFARHFFRIGIYFSRSHRFLIAACSHVQRSQQTKYKIEKQIFSDVTIKQKSERTCLRYFQSKRFFSLWYGETKVYRKYRTRIETRDFSEVKKNEQKKTT